MSRQIRPGQLQENVTYNISASFAVTASHALNAGAGQSDFPYTGSAIISGSLNIEGLGEITASGNISSSGNIIGSNLSGTNTGDQDLSNLAVTGSDVIFNHITALGDISSSGNIINTGNITTSQVIIPSNFDAIKISGYTAVGTEDEQLHIGSDANWTSIEYGRGITSLHEFLGNTSTSGNITASGNISSSGTIISSNLSGTNTGDITLAGTPDYITLSDQVITRNQIDLTNDVTGILPSANLDADTAHLTTDQTFSGNKTFSASITASAEISSSSTITGNLIVGTIGTATQGTIDHDSLSNFVANEHIDHTTVTLTAGNGLSGGGDISTDRSFEVDSTQTTITSVTNTSLKVGRGTTDTYIDFGTDDKIQLNPSNTTTLEVETTGIDITGAITASGDISSSGTISANSAILATVDINGGTIDGITSLTANGDLDIGAHELRAETFESDVTTGTSPFTVASTTAVTNLQSATATTLHTARDINGVSFNGSANITITAAGSTLSDTVPVIKGGTGTTSFTDKSVIITQDSGTDTLSAVDMSTNGQLLIGGTNGPAAAVPTGGDGLTVTVGDGSLEYDLDSSLTTVTSILATDLVLGEDTQTKIDFETANEIHFDADNTEVINIKLGHVDITGHVSASGNISASRVYEGTYHTFEASGKSDTNDDTNWQGPTTKGIYDGNVWNLDFGSDYDGTSDIISQRTDMNTGWRIPHQANYSCSIKSMDVYIGGASNITYATNDHVSCSLWYSTAANIAQRTNQTSTSGFTQKHATTVISTQLKDASTAFSKYNNYHMSQSINLDLAPGAMIFPRIKSADGSSNNSDWQVYWVINYCKIPL